VNERQFCQNIDILDIDNHAASGGRGAGAGSFDNEDQMQLTLNPKILRDSFVTVPSDHLATMQTPPSDAFQAEIVVSGLPSRNAAAAAKRQMSSTQSSISLIKPAEEARFNLGSKNLSRHSSNSKLKKVKASQQPAATRNNAMRPSTKNTNASKIPTPTLSLSKQGSRHQSISSKVPKQEKNQNSEQNGAQKENRQRRRRAPARSDSPEKPKSDSQSFDFSQSPEALNIEVNN